VNEQDPGIARVELLAYTADLLSYYQDQAAKEAQLRTRRRWTAVLAFAVALVFCRRCRKDG